MLMLVLSWTPMLMAQWRHCLARGRGKGRPKKWVRVSSKEQWVPSSVLVVLQENLSGEKSV